MNSIRYDITKTMPVLKVILLGDSNTGKTSLMNRFVHNRFDIGAFHTIGVEFVTKTVNVDSETYTVQIWDTAGQERFRSLRTPFYRGADCCVLTFAMDDVQSFKNLPMWKSEFSFYADVPANEPFPFIVAATKSDLNSPDDISTLAAEWCREHGLPLFETSAKENINIDDVFVAAIKEHVKMDRKRTNGESVGITISLGEQRPNKRASKDFLCC